MKCLANYAIAMVSNFAVLYCRYLALSLECKENNEENQTQENVFFHLHICNNA